MKSIFITLLMFLLVLAAMQWGIFDLMSNKHTVIFAFVILIAAFIFALKVLGNPFTKDVRNGKNN